jgi:hypothetical protein
MATNSTTVELDQLLKASKQVRRRHEPQWLLNLSYYDSRQWVAFDGRTIFEPELEDWRSKLVDNRIRGIVRTEIAKMTKNKPVWVAVPRTADDEDIASARLTERALDYQWGELDLTRKLRAALLWSRIACAGFWKVWWDPNRGDATEILVYKGDHPEAGQPVRSSQGRIYKASQSDQLPASMADQVQSKQIQMGDVCVDLRSPFEMFPDPLAGEEGLESAEWVIEEAVYSREYLEQNFGADAAKLQDDADPAGIETSLPGPRIVEDGGAAGYRGVKVREYWCKPGSKHARGKRVVWAQDTLLMEDDNPYPWLPYVMFTGTPVPGRFWPSSVTTDLISPQTEMNKRKSQIAENAERFGNPALMRSAHNADVEWHGLPGEELVFEDIGTPGSVPAFLIPPEMPGYVQNDIERIEQSIREISGQHEVTSGSVPTGVTAASAINLLQEQDDTRLGPDIGDMEQSIAGAGRRITYLMAKQYTDERTIRIAGEDGAWEIDSFRGTMLAGQQDIQVQSGSGLPQSKAAKQAAIQSTLTQLLQAGIQIPERQMRRVLNQYEIGGLEAFFANVSQDERQITEENRRLLAGEQLDINAYDSDDAHVEGHEEFQKTSRYQRLSLTPDGQRIQQNFEAHVAAHRQRQAQNQLAAAQAQQPPGAPSGAPQPPSAGPSQNGGAPPMPVPG